jgi:hypothetical protein
MFSTACSNPRSNTGLRGSMLIPLHLIVHGHHHHQDQVIKVPAPVHINLQRATRVTYATLASEDTQNGIPGPAGFHQLPIRPADPRRLLPVYRVVGCRAPSELQMFARRGIKRPEELVGEEGFVFHLAPGDMVFGVNGIPEADAEGLGEAWAVGAGDCAGCLVVGAGKERNVWFARMKGTTSGRNKDCWLFIVPGAVAVVDVLEIAGHGSADQEEAVRAIPAVKLWRMSRHCG